MSSGTETGGAVAVGALALGAVLKVWDRLARRRRARVREEERLRQELWDELDALRRELRVMRQDHAIEIATMRAQHAQEVSDLRLELNYWRELATTNRRSD